MRHAYLGINHDFRPVSFRIVVHASARDFLRRAQPWLLKAEAEHNLILGIARERVESGEDEQSHFLVTVESGGQVAGCAFRTSPFKLGLTRMPLKAIPDLVDVAGQQYDLIPGVLGPNEEARYFSRLWCGPRALSFRPVMDQRIYQLDQLSEPDQWPDGTMRDADEKDGPLLVGWLRDFFDETNLPVKNPGAVAHRLLAENSAFVWSAGDIAVSMAGITGRTPNGVRIGFVFTPAEHRKKGFGSAITATVTRRILDGGNRFCFLYTDAANPTSNTIYQRLGYKPVASVVDYQFF